MNLQEKIVSLRKRNGWFQEEFADRMNVSRQAISRWENGSALPDALNILQMSKIFSVTTDYLLNDDIDVFPSDGITSTPPADQLLLTKKKLNFIAMFAYTIGLLYSFITLLTSDSDLKIWISVAVCTFCFVNALVHFILFSKKLK